jgi:hypothetical protein
MISTTMTKRVFARVSPELHEAAKISAVRAHVRLEDWLADAIREKLDRQQADKSTQAQELREALAEGRI